MEEVSRPNSVRILVLEDNRADRELLERTLAADGIISEIAHTQTKIEFETAVAGQQFDLILSDFSLPGYDGMSALAAARKYQSDTPFIFVSGTIGEERAVESLRSGATDYVLKDRRDRLSSAVRRALHEAQEREERRQLERQLRQSQKIEAIGQLAEGVAHDFNNLLAVIQGNAELALDEPALLNKEIREFLLQITAATERGSNLVRQLLALGRKEATHLEATDLRERISNLISMLERLVGKDITLRQDTESAPLWVRADGTMMDQVILNLVVNARDAMPQGGEILISAEKTFVDAPRARAHPEAYPGEFICLAVRDTGCGIAQEHLPHIFEPFFTTKDAGKGTGLGLATVFGIVRQHHGWIEVSSEVGEGTVFRIFLPALQKGNCTEGHAQAQSQRPGGSERILLVEDDGAVRLVIKKLLTASGYRITEAASGLEALQACETAGQDIQLLLTDVMMPGPMKGPHLAAELQRRKPGIKVLFLSGHGYNAICEGQNPFSLSETNILHKPVRTEELLKAVRSCLDSVHASF